MEERDRKGELRAGSGCLAAFALVVALAFWRTIAQLEEGAETVHPVIWPLWKVVGESGLPYAGGALVACLLLLALLAFTRSRRQ
ncbi:MAG: hypothetical protein AAF411_15685 [Myxococcota bacterium]